MNLETRIKQLMEGKSEAKTEDELIEKVTIEKGAGSDEDIDIKGEEEKAKEDGADVSDDGEEDDEENTDVANDAEMKKNKLDVKEDFSASDYNNSKTKPGLSKKDAMEKITPDTHKDAQDDKGLNAKLKVGLGKKEASQLKKASAEQNPANSKNDVDTQKGGAASVKEHMDAMFEGEDLSEAFVSKAATIFEAAVADQVAQRLAEEVEALQEEFQVKLDEAVEEVQDALVENVDGFLNKVVEMWLEDNAVALESGIKVEMVTSFIDGMKTLFTEHYIEVPEEKLNVVEEQAAQIEQLKKVAITLDESNDELSAELVAVKKARLVEHASKSLTSIQAEKFAGLCEGIEFTSNTEFESKIKTIKESYFPAGKVSSVIPEKDVAAVAKVEDHLDAHMSAYSKALSGPLKF